MRIGVAAARLGDVDGVSFEVIKWHTVLTALGHEMVYAAGSLKPGQNGVVHPEMRLDHAPSAAVSNAAFDPTSDAAAVRDDIERLTGALQLKLERWIEAAALDRLVVQNAWAIPMQIPLGLALARAARATGIPTIGHHHDYWWERERFAAPLLPDVLEEAFPPDLPTVRHVSINSLAAGELLRRRDLHSTVIPNVFDFAQPMPVNAAQRARRLRRDLGLDDDGLLVIQPTRVVPRKGIELSIELVARLQHRQAVLLITSPAGDEGFEYLRQLEKLSSELGVDMRYDAQRFQPTADATTPNHTPEPTDSLIDAYLAADVVTYPSYYEGFGNALVEAIYFSKPIVVNRYSVYEADIRPLGFRFVELNGSVTDEAVQKVRALLADPALRAAQGRHNFVLGKQYLSYDRLASGLVELLA